MFRRSKNPGERLSHLMEEQGLNNAQLSQMTGVPAPTISRIRNGRRVAEIKTLVKLAGPLHTTVGYLSGDEPRGDIDPDIASFFRNEWHELTLEERMWLRNTLQMMRQSLTREQRG